MSALTHLIPSAAAWLTLHYLGQEQLKACEPYVVILYATKSEPQIPPRRIISFQLEIGRVQIQRDVILWVNSLLTTKTGWEADVGVYGRLTQNPHISIHREVSDQEGDLSALYSEAQILPNVQHEDIRY